MRQLPAISALPLFFILLLCVSASAETSAGRVVYVFDGDTIKTLSDSTGETEVVRLMKIDTPEKDEAGFSESKEALASLIMDRNITLETVDSDLRDVYGRLLAYVFLDGTNINVEMVRLGWSAFVDDYGAGQYAEAFRAAEAEARAEERGIWEPPPERQVLRKPPNRAPSWLEESCYVDVRMTINPEGIVTNAEAIESNGPSEMNQWAVNNALAWTFEPVERLDDEIMAVRIDFTPLR